MIEIVQKFFEVIIIDLVMSGDNAIVIGIAVAGLPTYRRKRIIATGITIAIVLRVVLALVAVPLLSIVGLTLAGGLLLAWICYSLWSELRTTELPKKELEREAPKNAFQALLQIIIADVSMSLDNVLAIAGAARQHPGVLIFGLAVSIVLMGTASAAIAKILEKHKWVGYVGLCVVAYVALEMIYAGGAEVLHAAAASF